MRDTPPPFSEDAEAAVLGAVLLHDSAFAEASEILPDASMFWAQKHRVIWRVLESMHEQGVPVDVVTLTEACISKGMLAAAGGAGYLAGLSSKTPSAANVAHYARIVQRKYAQRVSRNAALNVVSAIERDADPQKMWATFAETIEKANALEIDAGSRSQQAVMDRARKRWKAVGKRLAEGGTVGIPSGFRDVDHVTMGWQKQHLVTIAARPAMGKTSFMIQCVHAAGKHAMIGNTKAGGKGELPGVVVVLSLEMSDEDLITRMVSCTSHIDGTKIATDNLTQEEESRVSSTATGLETLPIEYLPPSVATPALLIARLRALSSKYTVKAVFIDYLQLMKSGHKVNSKYEDVTNVSQELKGIARNFDIPVIALAQLSRACESRPFVPAGGKAPKGGDRRPMLSDLRDSGAIEQDSDIIAFIYRDDYYNKDPATHDGFAEFNVAKWRFGKTGTVRLMFDGPTTAFHTVKQP